MQNSKTTSCIETHIAKHVTQKVRLQEYAIGIFEAITTKSALKKSIKKKLITRNGVDANTSDWIEEGDVLKLYAEDIQLKKKVFLLQLDVLYEDEFLAVIYKPSGYPTNGNYYKTIENALPFNLKESQEKDKLPFPQPVHRLDNPTSGVLLIAKTSSSKTALSILFQNHKISKTYVAVVEGSFPTNKTILNSAIEGKPSETRLKLENTFTNNSSSFSLLKLWPSTGRTHQLRIHLSLEGHPIVGDSAYGSSLPQKNILLHAQSLQFEHPKTQKSIQISSELPHKFVKFINA